jgi:hypothetical protein
MQAVNALKMAHVDSVDLPSIIELSKDPFMKQVSHAEKILPLLEEVGSEEETEGRLKAMFSHSDGIRGFFVTYLTSNSLESTAEEASVPPVLISAMKASESAELISLACMNVIMPTAMVSMHESQELAAQSMKTAARAIEVLAALKARPSVEAQCEAILSVAMGESVKTDSDRINYWNEFFDKWGYKDVQKRDIAKAIRSVLNR